MTPEERSDLAALHALSLLEGEEAARAIRLEAADPEFAAEVAAFAETAAELAAALPLERPSDLLRERVLSLVRPAASRPRAWIGWAAAAVLALTSAGLWLERNGISSLQRENGELTARLEALGDQTRLSDLRIASLEGQLDEYKGARAVVVWDTARGEGRIDLANLPAAEQGKVLQLWIVDPARPNPVSGGLIHREADGTANVPFHPAQKVGEASAFAISVERAGGVEVAEGPVVLIGK